MMAQKKKQRRFSRGPRERFSIRLPLELKARVVEEACASGMSQNELIVQVLTAWVEHLDEQVRAGR